MRLSLSLKRLVSSRLHSQEPLGHLVEEQQDRGSRPDLMGTQSWGLDLRFCLLSLTPLRPHWPPWHARQALASEPCQLLFPWPGILFLQKALGHRLTPSSLCSNVFSIRSSLTQLHAHTHTHTYALPPSSVSYLLCLPD